MATSDDSQRDEEVESEENSSDDSDRDSDQEALKAQLADVPFEELVQARTNGTTEKKRPRPLKHISTKPSKSRPQELPAKKPVPRFREVIQVPKKRGRDPRFETHCGEYDERRWKKAYEFIYEESLPADRQQLQKLVKKEKDPEKQEQLKRSLASVETHLRREEERRKAEAQSAEWKRNRRDAVKAGKKPFFLKKSEQKKMELMSKFKELKESGKLEVFLAKRRKKNASKEHKHMPYRRTPSSSAVNSTL